MSKLNIAMTAPAGYRNQTLHLSASDQSMLVAAGGSISVDSRNVAALQKLGFTVNGGTLPNLSDKTTMAATVSMAVPAGVSEVHVAGVKMTPSSGRITVPRDMVEALIAEGLTL